MTVSCCGPDHCRSTPCNASCCEPSFTYVIKAPRGSGVISLNGAAARKAHVGDLLIICTYAPMTEGEVAGYKPKVVLLDEGNAIKEVRKFD